MHTACANCLQLENRLCPTLRPVSIINLQPRGIQGLSQALSVHYKSMLPIGNTAVKPLCWTFVTPTLSRGVASGPDDGSNGKGSPAVPWARPCHPCVARAMQRAFLLAGLREAFTSDPAFEEPLYRLYGASILQYPGILENTTVKACLLCATP